MSAGLPASVGPDWLTARPIAHRGLHDAARNVIENSLSAARGAIAAGYSIECDVQLTGDGEAIVFHDFELDRLTAGSGAVIHHTHASLQGLTLGESADRIATLPEFLSVIAGQVPLVCEIKSAFDGDVRLPKRVAEIASEYQGPLALKSFDPAVLKALRAEAQLQARRLPLGIVAEAHYGDADWAMFDDADKKALAALTHIPETRPDFLSYAVDDLPHAAGTLFRSLGKPVVCWTVRTAPQVQTRRWNGQTRWCSKASCLEPIVTWVGL